jgi:hypothetical protein
MTTPSILDSKCLWSRMVISRLVAIIINAGMWNIIAIMVWC